MIGGRSSITRPTSHMKVQVSGTKRKAGSTLNWPLTDCEACTRNGFDARPSHDCPCISSLTVPGPSCLKNPRRTNHRRFHADSTPIPPGWLTGKNRLATILNPVQRPTEDMLHHLFWVPIMHWARGRDEGYGWLSSLHGNRNFPGLTDYLRVLSSPTGMTCITNLRLQRSDTDFLTGKPGELLTCFPKTGPAGMRVLWDALNLSVTSIVPSRVPGTARSRWPSACARRRGAPRCPRC